MSTPLPVFGKLAALTAAAVLFTGCSGQGSGSPSSATPSPSPSSSQNESVAQVCAAADAFGSALTDFKDMIKPDTTIEQLRSARDQVAHAYDDLAKATENLAQERADAVVAAEKEFTSAVNAVSNQATVPEAAATLRSEAAKVQAAVTDLRSDIKC
jgi:methyl-accepting chemotaxis protein